MANKYTIQHSKRYKKSIKKFDNETLEEIFVVVERLANGETLEEKYRDHKLQGAYKAFRECHIRPNLCLIYQRKDDMLILVLVDVGSHSDLRLTS